MGIEITKAIFACRLHPMPVSLEGLEQDTNGEVFSTFTRAWSDGTMGIKRSPLERLEKRAALIPLPRGHAIAELGDRKPQEARFVESWLTNANKAFAVFRP